jgi:carboxypeptidase family protein/TonB-dependent receptor-like protein
MNGQYEAPGMHGLSCLCVGLLLLAVAPLQAQTVRGTVVSAGDGEPIADVQLVLRGPDGELRAASISSVDGRFELSADEAGMVQLEVSHLGHADWETAAFALPTNEIIEVEVKLGVEAIPLEPITVVARTTMSQSRTAQFRARMDDPARVGGYFIPEEEIERRPMATVSNLVLAAPGMSVALASGAGGLDRNVIMAGSCVAQMFVDGIRVSQTNGASIDDLLDPTRVAGVEMYPRALGAPAQYLDGSNPRCGVVLFWTKEPERNAARGASTRRIVIGLSLVVGILTLGLAR